MHTNLDNHLKYPSKKKTQLIGVIVSLFIVAVLFVVLTGYGEQQGERRQEVTDSSRESRQSVEEEDREQNKNLGNENLGMQDGTSSSDELSQTLTTDAVDFYADMDEDEDEDEEYNSNMYWNSGFGMYGESAASSGYYERDSEDNKRVMENSRCTYKVKNSGYSTGPSLFQYNLSGRVLARFLGNQFVKRGCKKIRLVGVTERELFFRGKKSGRIILYRIPLRADGEKDIIDFDKKEVICKFEEEQDVWKELFLFATGNLYYFQNIPNDTSDFRANDCSERVFCADKKTKARQYVSQKKLSFVETRESSDGDVYAIFRDLRGEVQDFYLLPCQKGGRAKKILSGVWAGSKYAVSNAGIYYSALMDREKKYDYNRVYQYNFKEQRKRLLVSERDYAPFFSQELSENADILRELRYQEGVLYLEVRYGDECSVLSLPVEKNEPNAGLQIVKGIRELVRHKEYSFDQPLGEADETYPCANDHNFFVPEEDGIVERTLTGGYVRTIHLPDALSFRYVNNQEMICMKKKEIKGKEWALLYSVPLSSIGGNDFPQFEKRKKITKMQLGDFASEISYGKLYADENYLIFMYSYGESGLKVQSMYNIWDELAVYDRTKKEYISFVGGKIRTYDWNMPKNFSLVRAVCGDNLVFRGDDKRGTSYYYLYHFGEKDFTKLSLVAGQDDEKRDYLFYKKGEELIYEVQKPAGTLYYGGYNIRTGKQRTILTNEDLYAVDFGSFTAEKMWLCGDKMYVATSISEIWSLELDGEKKPRKEEILSKALWEDGWNLEGDLGNCEMIDGKLISGERERSGVWEVDSYCYDSVTGERWSAGGYELLLRWWKK